MWRRSAVLTAATLCLAACVSNPAPRGWAPLASMAGQHAYGAWVELGDTAGEFLGFRNDSIFLLPQTGSVVSLPRVRTLGARLGLYDSQAGLYGVAAVSGMLFTFTNGVFLVLTAPVWLIAGSVAAGAESRAAVVTIEELGDWQRVTAFARFPQGVPPDLPSQLAVKRPT